ncbi:MAG TPA: PilZ domain-containing protein [candidate division Zixibacteria bacterium]|jgi:c-di-GMP-binding flagellar brake protein YcgR
MTTRKAATAKPAPAGTAKSKSQKRRYVRLEVFSPVEITPIVVDRAENRVRRHPHKKAGVLLNLSGGGVLISTTDTMEEEDVVLMRFDIKGFDSLNNILGRVKRVELRDDGERLVGVEFLSPRQVTDPVLARGLAKLSDNPQGFEESVGRLISRYVFQRQIESESE